MISSFQRSPTRARAAARADDSAMGRQGRKSTSHLRLASDKLQGEQGGNMLAEIGSDIRRIAERAGAACVGVGRHNRVGSGVVMRPGQVVTNAHNLGGGPRTITFADGRQAV